MGAVLACGPHAVLSHLSAGAVWGILGSDGRGAVHVSIPEPAVRVRPRIHVHRSRAIEPASVTRRLGIPVTKPVLTLVNLADVLSRDALEAAVNEADARGVIDPERLRSGLEHYRGFAGAAALRATLDRHTFSRTDSWAERRFLRIARHAGLPKPLTRQVVNGFRVDFYWPDLRLVVETDGLTCHRTAGQQTKDTVRDQAHHAAGLRPLRFTRAQLRFEPEHVADTLVAVAARQREEIEALGGR